MGRGKSQRSLEIIEAAYEILAEINPASVRAVCYRLFAAGVIESMQKRHTNRVSTQLTWAREQRIIPWSWIVDETREPERIRAWEDPADYVETVKRAYRRDRWADQSERVEVWSEKGTIRGTLRPVLDAYGITFRVNHGYGSATAVHRAAHDSVIDTKPLIVYYVGDHDPSGRHMSDVDLPTRIDRYGGSILMMRLALMDADVEEGTLPWFSADTKKGDRRYRWFVDQFGKTCVELDAMNPNDLRARVEAAIIRHIDREPWQRAEVAEAAELESLASILSTWPGISRQAPKYERGRP